jgi:predicted anti-sigma-YlaC factor YlaD
MTCREFADFLGDYLAGELRADVNVLFQDHLAVCPNCVRYLDQYRETVALGRDAFADAEAVLPSAVPEDLVRAILTARALR